MDKSSNRIYGASDFAMDKSSNSIYGASGRGHMLRPYNAMLQRSGADLSLTLASYARLIVADHMQAAIAAGLSECSSAHVERCQERSQ